MVTLAGAGILHRTWEWTQANPSPELERFEHYLTYGLFILAETPQNQCPKDFSLPAHDAAFQQIASRMAQRDNTDRALKLVATEARQHIGLFRGLDTLRDDADADCVRVFDHGANHRSVAGAGCCALYETSVELHH